VSGRRPPGLPQDTRGLHVQPRWLQPNDRAELLAYLGSLTPLWEQRYSTLRPPPRGEAQRPLLRPVYWLGNWQFACLGYYEPPRRTKDCAVQAEPYPPVLQRVVAAIEARARKHLPAAHFVPGWTLNTCLVNFYGSRAGTGGEVDAARVGDHRDFEPGPVASLSLGEKAIFQFVRREGSSGTPVRTMPLEDGSLQVFGGPLWKDTLYHRVQRVEDKGTPHLGPPVEGFRTRRINLTFRYVPPRDIVPWAQLGAQARADVEAYVRALGEGSGWWREVAAGGVSGPTAGGVAAPAR
jgi:alkylated DNA repair dioxygenase AlkB